MSLSIWFYFKLAMQSLKERFLRERHCNDHCFARVQDVTFQVRARPLEIGLNLTVQGALLKRHS